MKNVLRKILESLSLLEWSKKALFNFKSLRWKRKLLKYKNVPAWNLELGNLNLSYNTTDWYSKRWFFPRYTEGRIHEPVATKLFMEHISSNSQVIDVGGHLGYFSCIAGRLANTGQVNVFEVDPKCIGLIEKNVALNGLNNVSVNNYAASDNDDIIKIPKLQSPNPSLIINSNSEHNFLEVQSITLDDFVFQNNIHPNFIKIDVEGAEGRVLKGMKNILKQKDLRLLIEIHVDTLRDNFDTDYKELINLLLENEFILQNIDHRLNESSFVDVDINTILKGNTMILCTKKIKSKT